MKNKARNNKKNILCSVLLGILFTFSIYSLPANAAEGGSCGTFMEWSLDGDVLTITGSGDMADYSDGNLAPWYEFAGDIKSINFPSGILSIKWTTTPYFTQVTAKALQLGMRRNIILIFRSKICV